jgi:uncharacterized protein (DUF58 family)
MLAGAGVLVVAGWVLGVVELYVLGAGLGGLVAACTSFVVTRRLDLQATRHLRPPHVYAGDSSRVDLIVRNPTRRRSPVVTLKDALSGGPRQASLLLPPLEPGQAEEARYRLPAETRGVFPVGPLRAERTDPFGLARRTTDVAPVAELTVYPTVDAVRPLPDSPGSDRHLNAPRAAFGVAGEDFYALRAYEVGDDLRRVHWPSTARRDELMIRQNETPWQGRATVLLDTRARYHTDASFEQAVSAAASVASACWRRRSLVRLLTTDGEDTGFGTGPGHLEQVLTRLALVERSDGADLVGLTAGHAADGAFAAVTTAAVPPAELAALSRLGWKPSLVTLVVFDGPGRHPGSTRWPAVGHLVRVAASQPFAPAWDRAMSVRLHGAGHLS